MGKRERESALQDGILAKMSRKQRDELYRDPDANMALLNYELEKLISRRRFFKMGAGVAVGATLFAGKGLLWLEEKGKENREQDKPTHLEVLAQCEAWFPPRNGAPLPAEPCITVAGLGWRNSKVHAEPMALQGFRVPQDRDTPMSYLVSSFKGKKVPEVAALLKEAVKDGQSLSYYGQSNGAVLILEALNYLKVTEDIVIPINRFVLNCSPFEFADAKGSYIEKHLAEFLVDTSYQPGDIEQFLFLLKQNWTLDRENMFMSFLQNVEDAWGQTQRSDPLGPWIDDLRTLVTSRLREHNFEGIITRNTKMLFLWSREDDVIHTESAIDNFGWLADKYGAEFTDRPLPEGKKHGDSQAGSMEARPWIDETARGARIPHNLMIP